MIKRSKSLGKLSDYLPEDVVVEILWRVPLNSIIRCGCVCKSWYSLIRSRNFISTHLRRTKNTQVLLRNNVADRCNGDQLSLIFENASHQFDVDHLDCRVLRLHTDPFFRFILIGSCNGLVCLVDHQFMSRFILCNPSIRHSLSLPMPQFVPLFRPTLQLLGFGFDDRNQDCKIVRIVKSNNYSAAEVYSLNSNCWRDIDNIPNFVIVKNKVGAFVNGRLHWLVRDGNENTNLIMVFDLKDETFHQIPLPQCLAIFETQQLRLREFEESSIVVVQFDLNGSHTRIWVMKEYGAVESWKTTTTDQLGNSIYCGSPNRDTEEFYKLLKLFDASVLKYVPSLVLLDKQNN